MSEIKMVEKYPVGATAVWPGQGEGTVMPNTKMPGDICIQWNCGIFSSYDEDFLEKHGVYVIEIVKGVLLPRRHPSPVKEQGE